MIRALDVGHEIIMLIPENFHFPSYLYLHAVFDPTQSKKLPSMSTDSKCAICLSQLEQYETEYPLLCPANCTTNVCTNCSALLSQQPCADVNANANVTETPKASCPKCNADISQTIKDTHLWRCVKQIQISCSNDTSDSQLTGAELRMKYSASKEEMTNAQRRLDDYCTSATRSNSSTSSNNVTQTTSLGGKKTSNANINTVLLVGLESFMSAEEQQYITELLTSGMTDKLAQAAQILSEIKRIHIGETSEDPFRNLKKMKDPLKALFAKKPSFTGAEQRAIDMSAPSLSERDLELPHMPKYVVLKADFDAYARHSKVLKFEDDTWDGSMADAFSRMYTDNSNTQNSDDDSDDSSSEESKNDNRVVVTASRKQAARAGIVEGDVISHVNMEEFRGCAENLRDMIQKLYIAGNASGSFSIVLNGDQTTADELRKRQLRHHTT